MIDELARVESEDVDAPVRDMNLDLLKFYRKLLNADAGNRLIEAEPLYLFIAVLGANESLSSAQPLIRQLLSKGTDMEKVAVPHVSTSYVFRFGSFQSFHEVAHMRPKTLEKRVLAVADHDLKKHFHANDKLGCLCGWHGLISLDLAQNCKQVVMVGDSEH